MAASRRSCSPERCWIVLAAKSAVWLFVFVNLGILLGVIAETTFGTRMLGLHAILLLCILTSLALVGLCANGELRSHARGRASTSCRAEALTPTPRHVVSDRAEPIHPTQPGATLQELAQ